MAELAKSKKYFTLSSVRIAHRAKDDTFHLTAQDEDFPEGFHMTLSSGSNLESRMRELFEEHGLVKSVSNLIDPSAIADTWPQALFIGDDDVAQALVSLRREWRFLPPVPNVEKLQENVVDYVIDNHVQYLFVLDKFFNPDFSTERFEKLVVTTSPHCFLGIISYSVEKQSLIAEAVGRRALQSGMRNFAPYFFIDPKAPNRSIDDALTTYGLETPHVGLPLNG